MDKKEEEGKDCVVYVAGSEIKWEELLKPEPKEDKQPKKEPKAIGE